MSKVLKVSDVERLVAAVDTKIRDAGCDHTLRFTEQWAAGNGINWDDLVDVLEVNGAFCDCEVVLNITEDSQLDLPQDTALDTKNNPWLIPVDFTPKHDTFTKQLVCRHDIARNTYSNDGEVLVPPPRASKPRKRTRKSMHYFVGLTTGLPSEVGIVEETEPFSAAEFARIVRASTPAEFSAFTVREAAFVLSRLANLKAATPVATHFMDKLTMQGQKTCELRIHKILIRKQADAVE